MSGTALIAAITYVLFGGRGGEVCVCGCDCVGVGVNLCVCVCVIVWVKMAVCGWGSLDCCRKACCVVGRGGSGECVCVDVWVWV